ncbi:cytokine-induced anti-apoptosis inhibitor 1, Fe-S biogenesis-domain-containing protein [Achaetomium macrosporum]|uniref:Cytokine-induced anti-apoptosis inhibitor 1, Fe-S biogenesis-domain-containing protein n=1 Tax=Achaetomium macrosporum TaxID=79813 RepID=A0AAN7HBI2_9PEZI|nr:cytokine-induced anti-apoptosis inhibitor 1, Fe-S biogenesis-domain-containing protein [Achaetomium macrosporum]
MSPSLEIDLTPDFDPTNSAGAPPSTRTKTATTTNGSSSSRTLLLAPPSLASRQDRISTLFAAHPRATTDLQMLDRLAAGLVTLPAATYDLVLVLTDPDGSRRAEAFALLRDRAVWARLVPALKAGGRLRSEDGSLKAGVAVPEAREAVLAGLVPVEGGEGDGFTKPEYAEEEVVPLRFGLGKKKEKGNITNGGEAAHKKNGTNGEAKAAVPAGVGFVDFSDDLDLDLDAEDDDDVIDEDTLLTEEDLRRPIQQPPECQPQPGKKRRACKDCTCGLAARMEAEDKARRAKADKELNTLKLKSEDLNELDFTVPGKTGSCGSCYLGDAFRCSDCPYIGLPAFKPGEEVKILNNTVQL